MRRRLLTAAGCAATALPAGAADASWTPPQSVAAPYASVTAAATNRAGDAVVAWSSRRLATATRYAATVEIAIRDRGRLRTRRLWSGGHAEVVGLTAGIDGRRRITVAWTYRDREQQAPSGIVRAAYGSAGGRFGASHVVGRAGSGGGPRLAVASHGTVAMVWGARSGSRDVEHDAVAWHGPGRRFGAIRRLSGSPRAPSDPGGLRVAFGADGTGYVYGSCSASVLRARPGSRSFGRPIVIAGDVRGFGLALNGDAFAVASWGGGTCSDDPQDARAHGPVLASVLRAGRFSSPVAITSPEYLGGPPTVVALPRRRATISWRSYVPATLGRLFTASLESGVTFGVHREITDGLVPFAADAGGDLLLEPIGAQSSDRRLVVRPAGSGAAEAAPIDLVPVAKAVAAPVGRGAVLAWLLSAQADIEAPTQRVAFSVWRP